MSLHFVEDGHSRSSVLVDGVDFLMQKNALLIARPWLRQIFGLFISTLVPDDFFSGLCSGPTFGNVHRLRQIQFYAGVKSKAGLMMTRSRSEIY